VVVRARLGCTPDEWDEVGGIVRDERATVAGRRREQLVVGTRPQLDTLVRGHDVVAAGSELLGDRR
jgi:hypothetical protein